MCLSIDDLPHLRFLTLEFTGIDGNTHLPGQPNTLAWERFVDSAVNKLTLPALTLMVRMFHEDLDYLPNGVIYDDDAQMVAAYKAACQRIFEPLAHALKGQEDGLKRLFVAISSPIENLKLSGVRDYERVLERTVMGIDYDSHALGWDVLRRRCSAKYANFAVCNSDSVNNEVWGIHYFLVQIERGHIFTKE
ncbi:hypothetical protein CIHG_01315 [Coccidioides immitis H538.4]|uniref:Uncharacterized protein n=3 Tax=Coccidioides immitis TaxID=5501 RepID=A0A0J8QJY6_COCIT|nr:hypothetical protein CIRG_01160 [Coccidioides immitis RMSCC 2394]KMU72741.1 hypothetical protein CISG_03175 [Coccidioides immitis RMSCC 3703]KMU83532.1 hypothetical protein CIHG_01315 [Coccidioides immitis H538.4]TPX26041.1 hypothetical protein DIZ76_011500 [Coccidioides immitis]